LRKALGITQVELATRVGITQSQLSKLEHRENHRIATLRRYVHALGGSLEINAVVNGQRVRVSD
jgi:transcriptional regulator with XRE-family HTH domain